MQPVTSEEHQGFFKEKFIADHAMIVSRWKTAPFIVESYGNGRSPSFPCQTFTEDATKGAYELYAQVPEHHVAAVKNASFCSGPWSDLPGGILPGTYELRMTVVDAKACKEPMALALQNRTDGGSYSLGSLTVR